MAMVVLFSGFACSRPEGNGHGGAACRTGAELPDPATDADKTSPTDRAVAVFAGGCFWCVEAVFGQIEGVTEVVSGYAGGSAGDANYRAVSAGRTEHAEAVQITYDPSVITYGQLLKIFFATHDPTQVNRQGPDVGRQYRSAVFYADDQQKHIAAQYINQLRETGAFTRPIATTLEPLDAFHPAEDHHQDYVRRNPNQRYVVFQAMPKVNKVRQKFSDMVKDDRPAQD
jgi:peptide-methionine (S)-S-oxide reductase